MMIKQSWFSEYSEHFPTRASQKKRETLRFEGGGAVLKHRASEPNQTGNRNSRSFSSEEMKQKLTKIKADGSFQQLHQRNIRGRLTSCSRETRGGEGPLPLPLNSSFFYLSSSRADRWELKASCLRQIFLLQQERWLFWHSRGISE